MKLTSLLIAACFVGTALPSFAQQRPAYVERALPEQFRQHTTSDKFERLPIALGRQLTSRSRQGILLDTIFREDFANGLAEWTVVVSGTDVPDQLWEYTTADFTGGRVRPLAFNGPTKANGYASLDFAKYVESTGEPITGRETGVNQDLISPTFSTADYAGEKLAISFYQLYRYLIAGQQTAYISYSIDGGDSFTEPSEINPKLRTNAEFNGRVALAIPDSLVGFPETQVRFTYNGGYYSLAIDDIVVAEQPPVQLGIDSTFYTIAPNFTTPPSQLDSIYPATAFYNRGSEDQDVVVGFRLVDAEFNTIDSLVVEYGSLSANTEDSTVVFPRAVAMPSTPGEYAVVYDISSENVDDDTDVADNLQFSVFTVQENIFSKNPGATTLLRPEGDNPEYISGNIYHTPEISTASVTIDSIIFIAATDGFEDNGSSVGVADAEIWGYRGDLDGDGIPKFGTSADDASAELVLLGGNSITVDSTLSTASIIRLAANDDSDPSEQSLELPTDQGYVGFAVTVAYTRANSLASDNDEFLIGASDLYDYVPNDAVNGLLASQGRVQPRQTSLLEIREGGANVSGYFTFNFTSPTIVAYVNRDGVEVATADLPISEFGISPNPVNSALRVAYDFEAVQQEVQVRILNNLGQTVYSSRERGLGTGTLELSTDRLAEGVYHLDVTTSESKRASRTFVVAH